MDGETPDIELEDVLIVASYSDHVMELAYGHARVGETVKRPSTPGLVGKHARNRLCRWNFSSQMFNSITRYEAQAPAAGCSQMEK